MNTASWEYTSDCPPVAVRSAASVEGDSAGRGRTRGSGQDRVSKRKTMPTTPYSLSTIEALLFQDVEAQVLRCINEEPVRRRTPQL
jgi:hypothetical protein